MTQVKTINLRGNQYAQVKDRLQAFWEANPQGKIHTETTTQGEVTIFKAYVWKNKGDFLELLKSGADKSLALASADSNGTSRSDESNLKKEKGFEKLETIAVGRALAMLGYGTDGAIASSEEMENYHEFRANEFIKFSQECSTLKELRDAFMNLPSEVARLEEVVEAKETAKARLTEES